MFIEAFLSRFCNVMGCINLLSEAAAVGWFYRRGMVGVALQQYLTGCYVLKWNPGGCNSSSFLSRILHLNELINVIHLVAHLNVVADWCSFC